VHDVHRAHYLNLFAVLQDGMPSRLPRDDCCELGTWLGGMGQSKCGGKPSFSALVQAHTAFHNEAGKVARAINQGGDSDVEGMLGSGSAFSAASSNVTRLIVQLRKECA
jgi:methyl-accepting chemotaxis protein